MKTKETVSFFHKNLNALTERFPIFSLLLLDLDSNIVSQERSCLEISIFDQQIQCVCGLSIQVFNELKTWLEEKPVHRLVFLENDLEFIASALQQQTDLFSHPQVHIEWMNPGEENETAMSMAERFSNAKIRVAIHPDFCLSDPKSFEETLIENAVLFEAVLCETVFSDRLFANFFQNIKKLPESFSVNKLKESFHNIPAIICGAGPSLEKAMPELTQLTDRAIVFAGGSAITALSRNSVPFHFGVLCDPNEEEEKRIRDAATFEEPFLYSLRVNSGVFSKRNGPSGFIHTTSSGMFDKWFMQKLALQEESIDSELSDQALSVTTLSVAMAQFLGCNPIIFCGMDLGYTDGKRYTSGVLSVLDKVQDVAIRSKHSLQDVSENSLEKRSIQLLETSSLHVKVPDLHLVKNCSKTPIKKIKNSIHKGAITRPDIFNNPIETTTVWQMESNVINSFANNHPETHFINATEGGIGFKDIKNQPLVEVVKKYLNNPIDLLSLTHIHTLKNKYETYADLLKKLEEQSYQILSQCYKSCCTICTELSKMTDLKKPSGDYVLAKFELEESPIYQDFFSLYRYHFEKFYQYHLGQSFKSPIDKEQQAWVSLKKTIKNYLQLYS